MQGLPLHREKRMCRFLLAKSAKPFDPQPILIAFSNMAKKSKALDGDWQGDGWGMSFLDEQNTWQTYHALPPIWEDHEHFKIAQNTKKLVIHARSASFPSQKGVLAYNQPYHTKANVFVFNGLLKGVSFPHPIPGTVGAQKIWHLLQQHLTEKPAEQAFKQTIEDLKQYTTTIQALNLGFSDGINCFAYTSFNQHPEYYQLQQGEIDNVTFVVSEPIEGFRSKPMLQDQIMRF